MIRALGDETSGLVPRISYLRRGDVAIDYLPQVSSTLGADLWRPAEGPMNVLPLDGTWEWVTIDHPVPAGAERIFGRVAVTPR